MKDTLRKAVELAGPAWTLTKCGTQAFTPNGRHYDLERIPQYLLDALAAQLVRQVDAYCGGSRLRVEVYDDRSAITEDVTACGDYIRIVAEAFGPDRTLNTIKAIVDSGVLG
jgi:hypothetical protein